MVKTGPRRADKERRKRKRWRERHVDWNQVFESVGVSEAFACPCKPLPISISQLQDDEDILEKVPFTDFKWHTPEPGVGHAGKNTIVYYDSVSLEPVVILDYHRFDKMDPLKLSEWGEVAQLLYESSFVHNSLKNSNMVDGVMTGLGWTVGMYKHLAFATYALRTTGKKSRKTRWGKLRGQYALKIGSFFQDMWKDFSMKLYTEAAASTKAFNLPAFSNLSENTFFEESVASSASLTRRKQKCSMRSGCTRDHPGFYNRWHSDETDEEEFAYVTWALVNAETGELIINYKEKNLHNGDTSGPEFCFASHKIKIKLDLFVGYYIQVYFRPRKPHRTTMGMMAHDLCWVGLTLQNKLRLIRAIIRSNGIARR